jgi:hypothetical protein
MGRNKPGYHKERRAKLKALGLCAKCGKKPHRVGLTKCQECSDVDNSAQKRLYNKKYRIKAYPKQRKERLEKGLCLKCGKVPPVLYSPHCRACIDNSTKWNNNLKEKVYAAYGGYICACCGETIKQFLTIDHINNDGCDHRRLLNGLHKPNRNGRGSGKDLYLWLKRNNFPPGFQILCMNCNMGKARNNGVCPHKSLTA